MRKLPKKKPTKDREVYIQKGRQFFIHTKSPMTMQESAKIMIKCLDEPTEKCGIRKARKKKK